MIPSEPCLCEFKPCVVLSHIYLDWPYDLFGLIECDKNEVLGLGLKKPCSSFLLPGDTIKRS